MNDEPRHNSNGVSGSDFPCSRGDILLKLGMRGARLIPWQLKEGDVFRLGQARSCPQPALASASVRV